MVLKAQIKIYLKNRGIGDQGAAQTDSPAAGMTAYEENKRVLFSTHMRKLLNCPPTTKKSVDELLRFTHATNEPI